MRALLAIATLGLVAAAPAQAAPASVAAGDFFYKPYRVTVNTGEAVNWKVGGSGHTITSDRGAPAAFDSDAKDDGQSYSFTFTAAGRYRYVCTLHPGLMSGVVQVGPDTVKPKVSKAKAAVGKRSVKVSFRVSEEVRVKALFTRAGKVVKTVKTKQLRQGGRSLKIKRPKAGSYRVKLQATDLEGNVAKAVSKRFQVPAPTASE